MEPQQVRNLIDSNSSSESTNPAGNSSDFQGAKGEDISEDNIEPFYGIQT